MSRVKGAAPVAAPAPTSPTAPRVGFGLARLRSAAGISGRGLAARLGVSQATISRIESGGRLPSVPLLKSWLQTVRANDKDRAELMTLIEAGHTEATTHRLQAKTQPNPQDSVGDQEPNAVQTVPGFDRLTIEPDKLGGQPCIRGYRMSAAQVLELLAAGWTVDGMLDTYPFLEAEDVQQALGYAASLITGSAETQSPE